MKVTIKFSVDVSDYFRRALRHRHGGTGLATREEVKQWYENTAESQDDDVLDEYSRQTNRSNTAVRHGAQALLSGPTG